jgi:hypothetical protein
VLSPYVLDHYKLRHQMRLLPLYEKMSESSGAEINAGDTNNLEVLPHSKLVGDYNMVRNCSAVRHSVSNSGRSGATSIQFAFT